MIFTPGRPEGFKTPERVGNRRDKGLKPLVHTSRRAVPLGAATFYFIFKSLRWVGLKAAPYFKIPEERRRLPRLLFAAGWNRRFLRTNVDLWPGVC
jgi:hypothetical protein